MAARSGAIAAEPDQLQAQPQPELGRFRAPVDKLPRAADDDQQALGILHGACAVARCRSNPAIGTS